MIPRDTGDPTESAFRGFVDIFAKEADDRHQRGGQNAHSGPNTDQTCHER
jgi:hypothetical protein